MQGEREREGEREAFWVYRIDSTTPRPRPRGSVATCCFEAGRRL